MLNKTFNLVTTILLTLTLTSFQFTPINNKEPISHEVIVSTKIMGVQNHQGKWLYTEIAQIDEYDENGSINPFPDTIDVLLTFDLNSYYQKHHFLKGDLIIKDFYVDVSVNLIFSETKDCMNLINPKTIGLKTFKLNKRVNYSDFFKDKLYTSVNLSSPLLIKQLIKSFKKKDLFLSQINVTTKMRSLDNRVNIAEYCKPVCN